MKNVMKIILLILVGLFVLAFILLFFFFNSKNFSYSECDHHKSYPFTNYIEEAKWENNDLVVKTITTHNCCPFRLSGKYKISGNNIMLEVDESIGLSACMCVCNYESIFKIPNLEKKEYNIILYKDNLTLKTDSSTSDYCDSNRTFDCYKKNNKLSETFNYPDINSDPSYETYTREIRFEKPEHKEISDKYPDFLYYFNKSETLYIDKEGRHNLIVIGFKDGSITVGAHHGNSTEFGTFGGLYQGSGENFESAVINYINGKKFEYKGNPLIKQFSNQYGVNITRIYPNGYGFEFSYNNETVDYSFTNPNFNTLEFTDRVYYITFEFNRSLLDKNLSQQLNKLVNFSDMVYKLITENNLGGELLYIHINSNWTASFDALSIQKMANKSFIMHNQEIIAFYPTSQKFNIDSAGKFI
ncbi:MAG: hypothetical protein Q8N88_02465 [Nanoarchaeota archaeon]|nr:hypothetical protein [Nanoarchaeota archaeon]